MLIDQIIASGHLLFRWRSYLLLAFAPAFVWAVMAGETIEVRWGHAIGEAVEALAILMVLAGEAIRILTVGFVPRGTSGRNTGKGQIAEVLNTSGLYTLVRNPLYLGNCLMYLGLALYTQQVWLVGVLGLTLALYYERIIAAEEDFLRGKFGAPYTEWASRTPAFWPRLTGWRRPDLPFSLRTVIRREHASIFGGFVGLYLVEVGLHALPATHDVMPIGWHVGMAVAALVEATVIAVKWRTRLLVVEGR